MREWFWCRSKNQYTCAEVCQNNLAKGKCFHFKHGCKVKPKSMSEEVKAQLRALNSDRKSKNKMASVDNLLCKLRDIGPTKAVASLLKDFDVSESTIKSWIHRGNIPAKYRNAIRAL